MGGQGDGFQLLPGEYQIVPFTGSSCWVGGTLGCCEYGNECVINPDGRGGGLNVDNQPSTLFEWSVPGVWDSSLVDGYNLPMMIEVDGCSNPKYCNGSDPIVNLSLSATLCPNKILNKDNIYVGCKSMCGCQNNAINNNQKTDPECPNMISIENIVNKPYAPGGYCGCHQSECVDWAHKFYSTDPAGKAYCDAITEMTRNSKGQRSVYCQSYDDDAGTKSYGNGVIKVTIYNDGFESVKDRSSECTKPTPGKLPKCSDINVINDQCGLNKYICTNFLNLNHFSFVSSFFF